MNYHLIIFSLPRFPHPISAIVLATCPEGFREDKQAITCGIPETPHTNFLTYNRNKVQHSTYTDKFGIPHRIPLFLSLRGTACPDYFGKAISINKGRDCFIPRNDKYGFYLLYNELQSNYNELQ